MGHKQNKSAGRVVKENQSMEQFKGLEDSLKSSAILNTYTPEQKNHGLLNEENLLDE